MARRTVKPLFPIALTVHETALALGIPRDDLMIDVRLGRIPLYQKGLQTRLLVTDVVDYVREQWIKKS